jgi:hypothetical protein
MISSGGFIGDEEGMGYLPKSLALRVLEMLAGFVVRPPSALSHISDEGILEDIEKGGSGELAVKNPCRQ